MPDENQPKRGDAAWREQRDAIAERNVEARRKAQTEQKTRERVLDGQLREHAKREREQLQALNANIDKQRGSR